MKLSSSKLYAKAVILFFTIVCLGTKGFSTTGRMHFPAHQAEKLAQQELQVVIFQPFPDKAKLRVYVLNPEEREVRIRISNDMDVDYAITSKEIDIQRQFDLSEITDGWYKVEVTAGKEKISKTVWLFTTFQDARQLTIN